MRLIRVADLELCEFTGGHLPDYAILSHTWCEGEVSLQEFQNKSSVDKPGWTKIREFCRVAKEQYGCDWGWVDTCSIDKTSSSELSKAINSMFNWYRRSKVCIAYLSDVEADGATDCQSSTFEAAFGNSRWFTRGWTLQELLAPRDGRLLR